MLKYFFALIVFSGAPFLAHPALAQANLAEPPIMCDKDDIEDATCQDKLKGLFTRNGDTLSLTLDDGKSKTYVGNRAACDYPNADYEKCLVFRMLGYFPQTRSYLVRATFLECGVYLFVSRRSGSEIETREIPVLSPGARYLLSIDTSDGCPFEYDISIWSMQEDPPKLEFAYKADRYENWEVSAWESDTHIRIKGMINDPGPFNPYNQEAELVRRDGGWSLKLGKKSERR